MIYMELKGHPFRKTFCGRYFYDYYMRFNNLQTSFYKMKEAFEQKTVHDDAEGDLKLYVNPYAVLIVIMTHSVNRAMAECAVKPEKYFSEYSMMLECYLSIFHSFIKGTKCTFAIIGKNTDIRRYRVVEKEGAWMSVEIVERSRKNEIIRSMKKIKGSRDITDYAERCIEDLENEGGKYYDVIDL